MWQAAKMAKQTVLRAPFAHRHRQKLHSQPQCKKKLRKKSATSYLPAVRFGSFSEVTSQNKQGKDEKQNAHWSALCNLSSPQQRACIFNAATSHRQKLKISKLLNTRGNRANFCGAAAGRRLTQTPRLDVLRPPAACQPCGGEIGRRLGPGGCTDYCECTDHHEFVICLKERSMS